MYIQQRDQHVVFNIVLDKVSDPNNRYNTKSWRTIVIYS